jgi:hypothetical protein
VSAVPDDPVPAVWLREPCPDCDGSGEIAVAKAAGDARWSKRIECGRCRGGGRTARWVGLAELRELLDSVPRRG